MKNRMVRFNRSYQWGKIQG